MRAVRLIEAVENVLFGFVGDTLALVGDGEDHFLFVFLKADGDLSEFRAEFYRVADKVRPNVEEKWLVAEIVYLVKLNVKLNVLFRPRGFVRKESLAYLLVKAKDGFFVGNGLVIHLGEQKNIADKGGKPSCVEKYLLDIFRLFWCGAFAAAEQGRITLYGGDRRFKLV